MFVLVRGIEGRERVDGSSGKYHSHTCPLTSNNDNES